jgi:hypothetical protein
MASSDIERANEMSEPIRDGIIHKVEVKRRLPEGHQQRAAEQARIAAENIYRAFGIKNPHGDKK